MKLLPLKLRIYETVFQLNRAFEMLGADLDRLERFGFDPPFPHGYRVMAEELRAAVNHGVTLQLHEREQKDWGRFGRQRSRWDEGLRDPDDGLREAASLREKPGQEKPHPKPKPTRTRKPKRA